MILLELFWSFFQIGLFSFGGGYATLPLIQQQVVTVHHWLDLSALTDLITISQMTPGPIALNASTFVGMQVGGFAGAIVATLGCITPSCLIVSALAVLYQKFGSLAPVQRVLAGLRPAVVGLIASAAASILVLTFWGDNQGDLAFGQIRWVAVVLFALGLALVRKTKVSPIWVMVGAGVIGGILGVFFPGSGF